MDSDLASPNYGVARSGRSMVGVSGSGYPIIEGRSEKIYMKTKKTKKKTVALAIGLRGSQRQGFFFFPGAARLDDGAVRSSHPIVGGC